MFPRIFEMRDPTHDEYDIDGAVADDLVRDIYVAILGVTGLGRDSGKEKRRRGERERRRRAMKS